MIAMIHNLLSSITIDHFAAQAAEICRPGPNSVECKLETEHGIGETRTIREKVEEFAIHGYGAGA